LAFRPKPARGHCRPALPLPLRLTCGVHWSSPTPRRPPPGLCCRRPSPSKARFLVRGLHAKAVCPGYLKPAAPVGSSTRAV
jgi:hypothetical protein